MSIRLYDDFNNSSDNDVKNYKVIIAGLTGGPVAGSLTSEFAIGGGNDFTSAGELLRDIPVVGAALEAKNKFSGVTNISGRSATTELETRKVWNNSLIPDIPIEVEFYQSSTQVESIMEKMKRIKSAVFPTRAGAFFRAPLGYRFTGNNSRNATGTLTVQIGTWFRATGLLLVSESTTFSKEVNSNGHPISMKVQLTFQPFRAITYDEYLQYFRTANG